MGAYEFMSETKDHHPLHCVVCPEHGGGVIAQSQSRAVAQRVVIGHNNVFHGGTHA